VEDAFCRLFKRLKVFHQITNPFQNPPEGALISFNTTSIKENEPKSLFRAKRRISSYDCITLFLSQRWQKGSICSAIHERAYWLVLAALTNSLPLNLESAK